MLGVELQPEELLLGAVAAPWGEESDEMSSGEEVEGQASLGIPFKGITGQRTKVLQDIGIVRNLNSTNTFNLAYIT